MVSDLTSSHENRERNAIHAIEVVFMLEGELRAVRLELKSSESNFTTQEIERNTVNDTHTGCADTVKRSQDDYVSSLLEAVTLLAAQKRKAEGVSQEHAEVHLDNTKALSLRDYAIHELHIAQCSTKTRVSERTTVASKESVVDVIDLWLHFCQQYDARVEWSFDQIPCASSDSLMLSWTWWRIVIFVLPL